MKRFLLSLLALIASLNIAMAQGRTVSGRVLDEAGDGLINAQVRPAGIQSTSGAQNGAVTNIDGVFSLTVPDNTTQLSIEASGYRTQTVDIGGGDSLTIAMVPSVKTLDEAVVTANAVRREKRSLGYATTQVTGSELTAGGSVNPLNALVGKAAGVNITTTAGAPGSSSRIVLRGGSSIGRNNQALIVVDGVITNNSSFGTNPNSSIGSLTNQVDYGNRANDLNPEDIESISVLKGPAATALYGSAASNGALIITTKKGRRRSGPSKTDIEVSTQFQLHSILKLPEFQNRFGQGDVNGVFDDRRENFSWGEEFDGQLRPWGQSIGGRQKIKPYSALENNVADFFDVGQSLNNNIAFNGGSESSSFRLSLGALNNKSIFPGLKYNRYTVNFNGNTQLTNKFYAGIGVNYIRSNGDRPFNGQGGASIYNGLLQTPRDIPIRELRDLNDPYNTMDVIDSNGIQRYGYYGAYTVNPYYSLERYRTTNDVDRVFGHVTVGYQPLKWLRFENRFASDNSADRRYQKVPKFSSIGYDPFYENNDPQLEVGRYSEDIYNLNSIVNDLMVFANRDVTEDITLNGTAGLNYTQNRIANTFASTNEQGGLVEPNGYFLQNSNGQPFTYSNISLVRRRGVYADVSAGLRNTYFIGATIRNDKSSTIDKSYTYYGVNTAFVFSELFSENFRRKAFNYGKLRAAYATVGNDADPYTDATFYNVAQADGGFGSTIFPFNGITGFSFSNQLGNDNLTPEFSSELELGAELGFLNSRIILDASVYRKISTDQILATQTAATTGFTTRVINTGKIENKGLELALRMTPLRTRNVTVELFGTYTRNINEVKEIAEGVEQVGVVPAGFGGGFNGMSIVAAVGRPYGTFYTTGFETTDDGRTIVDSATGFPIVTTTARYFGSYLPKFQASWGTTITLFKSLTFNVLFDMKKGGQFYSRTRDIMGFVGTSKETEDRDPRVWENSVYQAEDGSYQTNSTPYDPYIYFITNSRRPESQNLVDASYVKLREARIGYVFPKKWFERTPFGGASFSVFGNNLALWTPEENKYADPEINSSGASNAQGFDYTAQPSQRNYGMDLRFTF